MSEVTSELPIDKLQPFLHTTLPGMLNGPLTADLISGGRSNLTYVLSDGARRWVLRRPPLGHVLATAHDVSREYRVLRALQGTSVPVPEPLVLADASVIGAPFYVMTYAQGSVLRERHELARFDAAAAGELAGRLIDVLATLHEVDPHSVGLEDLGRPDGYLERQLRRWQRQLEASRSRELPALEQLGARLADGVPCAGRSALVHGDYRLDNVVVDGSGAITAVLDWEMATLGDPLADLASTVVWWDGISGLDSPVAAVPGDVSTFPDSAQLVTRYAERSGSDVSTLPWYMGFAFYKIACIFEGIHFRAQGGLTVGEGFDRLGPMVPHLVERGHAALTIAA